MTITTDHTHELCTETHIGTGSAHRWLETHCVECGEIIPAPSAAAALAAFRVKYANRAAIGGSAHAWKVAKDNAEAAAAAEAPTAVDLVRDHANGEHWVGPVAGCKVCGFVNRQPMPAGVDVWCSECMKPAVWVVERKPRCDEHAR